MNRLQSFLALTLLALIILSGCKNEETINASDVVLLINSNTPAKLVAIEKIVPYLDHFGVKFKIVDIAKEEISLRKANPALVIIGHSEIAKGNSKEIGLQLEKCLNQCQSVGTGILSFDPQMPSNLLSESTEGFQKDPDVGALRFTDEAHYITGFRKPGETKELFGYMSIPKMSVKEGQAIITGNDLPLLVVSKQNKGKIAQWTSQDWMYYSILGPLGGLDDCLWRSIVWAARKPFVMQAIPPVVTMRVDDVVGSGRRQWDVTPFKWVKITNKYGFKPWLGLFPYNITPEGIAELKEIFDAGMATGTPHAFGRPPRKESEIPTIINKFNPYYSKQMAKKHYIPDYWYPDAIPYLAEYYDEFIYFNHNEQKPWPAETSAKILAAIDSWYAETGIPMGKYLVPHWGEISSCMIPHIQDKWGIDIVSIREADKSWGAQRPAYSLEKGEAPVLTAPFRLYDEPVVGREKEGVSTSRPSYNAGFRETGGRKLFDFSSMINDITGFEWMPDNDVEATADRGIKTISRGIEAKALAVLFTHETDYIYDVKPENWDQIFNIMSKGITRYNPRFLTTDEGIRLVRAFTTSEIRNSGFNKKTGELNIKMAGETDIETSVFVYTEKEGDIIENEVEIPVFKNEVTQVRNITK